MAESLLAVQRLSKVFRLRGGFLRRSAERITAVADVSFSIADGETLVISGFTRNREVRERTNLGTRGGWFGRGTVVTQKRVEILILLTPKIL